MCQKLIGLHPASPYSSPQPVYGLRSVCVCVCVSLHTYTQVQTQMRTRFLLQIHLVRSSLLK